MRFYVISDNNDTCVGMRLAGIEGTVVHEPDEVHQALTAAMNMDDVAVILMTEHLVKMCGDLVDDLKLNRSRPLIVEIPDRHGNGRAKDSITRRPSASKFKSCGSGLFRRKARGIRPLCGADNSPEMGAAYGEQR